MLAVTLAFFKPDTIVNIISPSFSTLDPQTVIPNHNNKFQIIRFHITRNTNYGDRYKLFEFKVDSNLNKNSINLFGMSLKNSGDTYIIDRLAVNGIAQDKGMELRDIITRLEIKNTHQIHRNWGYFAGMVILIIILSSQWQRSRQIKSALS